MDETGVKLVCFEFCGEKFAFNMDYLVEIVQSQYADITPFFSHIPLLRGKWNYRQRTVPIIDLRDFFGLEARGEAATENGQGVWGNPQLPIESEETKIVHDSSKENLTKSILVVKIRDQIFGLLTDTVLQVVPLGVFYEYPGLISTLPKKYFAGITIIHAEVVIILAIEAFINNDELDFPVDN